MDEITHSEKTQLEARLITQEIALRALVDRVVRIETWQSEDREERRRTKDQLVNLITEGRV